MDNLRLRILRWTEQLIASGAPGGVTVAAECGHPGAGLRSTFAHGWRLVICREGRARFLLMRAGGRVEVRLDPGEMLVVAPRTWVTNAPLVGDAYASLGVVFGRASTRLLSVRCGRARPGAAGEPSRVAVESLEVPTALTVDQRSWCEGIRHAVGARAARMCCHFGGLLLCRIADLLAGPPGETAGGAHATWACACRLMEERCDRAVSRAMIAGELGVHPNHLSRLFARFPGGSFQAQLQRLRLERAASLLHDRSLSLADVAHRCGFGGAHQLIRSFRRAFGVTPRRYRTR